MPTMDARARRQAHEWLDFVLLGDECAEAVTAVIEVAPTLGEVCRVALALANRARSRQGPSLLDSTVG